MKLPPGWKVAELGEIVRIASGQVSPTEPPYSRLLHVGPENLRTAGGIMRGGLRSASELGLISGKYEFDRRAILYSKIRPNLNKVGLPDFDGICSADMYPIWVRDLELVSREFLYCVMTSEVFLDKATSRSFRTGIPKINREGLMSISIKLPSISEQRKIAEILQAWDCGLATTEALLDSLQMEYVRIASRLLTPPEPILRHLSETTRPLTKRNQGAMGRDKVMGVSNKEGLVPMRVQTIADDISRYLVLPPKSFAYNPMRINVGSIAMSEREGNVLVSPDYVLFECLSGELLPEFLGHSLKTRWWRHHVNAGGSGSVRTRTYYNDLAAISIHTPPIADQALIAQALNGAEAEIGLVEKKIDLLRTQKRGLMQKLLTGEVRVNVEVDADS